MASFLRRDETRANFQRPYQLERYVRAAAAARALPAIPLPPPPYPLAEKAEALAGSFDSHAN